MSTATVKATALALFLASTALAAEPLRTVHDAARNRVWVLESDAVYLHEGTQKKRFELPGSVQAREPYSCAPALAIDAQGAVVVTSNVMPVLWRIDAAKAQVTRHELTLDADTDKDVGFTGLTYVPDQGVFFAVSATYGSLWRIDPLLRRAQKIQSSAPLNDTCGLTVERVKTRRTVVLCARGGPNAGRVHLAPDQRSAYVRSEPCLGVGAASAIAYVK
jgi:hypothetical protein